MGTNYYWRGRPCEHCGRYDEVHVGKSSAGWSFRFRGYRHDPDDGRYSPLGLTVTSRADWRKVFAEWAGALRDEYGHDVNDPIAWLDALPPPDLAQQRREDSPEWMGPYWRPSDHEWRDPEGFCFNDSEFS